ncbi:hypothetical protein ACWDTI_21715 [Gordonia sp. NPDC003424]
MVNTRTLHRRAAATTPTLVDRAAGESRVVVSLGPLATLDRDALADELVRLASISPRNRLGLWRNRASRAAPWIYDPERLAPEVSDWATSFPGTDHLDIRDKLTLVRRSTVTPDGLRVYVTGDYLITDLSHGVFGGGMVVRLWLYLSVCLSRPTPAWTAAPDHRPRLGWMLLRHLAARPRAIGELAAAGRRRTSESAVSRSVGAPSSGASLPATVSGYLDPNRLAALQAWRDEHAVGCSVAVLLMAVLTRAFDIVGITLSPAVHVVVDTSRYDPRLAGYLGNVAVGLNLPFTAPYDPRSLDQELRRAMDSGRPLAAMLAISAGELATRRRTRIVSPEPESMSTTLSFSHLMGLDAMPDGNWIGGFDAHRFIAFSDPVGARGIAVLTPKMRDRYDIAASFDERFHDAATVQRALDLATADPVALLTDHAALDVGGAS